MLAILRLGEGRWGGTDSWYPQRLIINNLKNLTATLYTVRSEDLFHCHVLHHSNPAGAANIGSSRAGNRMRLHPLNRATAVGVANLVASGDWMRGEQHDVTPKFPDLERQMMQTVPVRSSPY